MSFMGDSSGFSPRYGTILLFLEGEGTHGSTTITDSSPDPRTVTAFDGAQITTAAAAQGSGSIDLSSVGWLLLNSGVAAGGNWAMQNKWCVEGYFKANSTPPNGTGSSSIKMLYARRQFDDSTRTFIAYSNFNGPLQTVPGLWLRIDSGGSSLNVVADHTFSTSAFTRWAVEYDGADYVIRIADAEVQRFTSTLKHSTTDSTSLHIGYGWSSSFFLDGLIDNYCISVSE